MTSLVVVEGETQVKHRILTCKDAGGNCGHIIGPIANRLGCNYDVLIGGVPLYAIHGHCPNCGAPIHWTGNDEKLKRIMQRVKMPG